MKLDAISVQSHHRNPFYSPHFNYKKNLQPRLNTSHQYDKLIYYYADALGQGGAVDDTKEPEWELFDLEKDPREMNSVYDDPAYVDVIAGLKEELYRLQAKFGDERYVKDI